MFHWKFLALPALIAALLSIPRSAPAQVSINIGAAPVCPYGYFDYAPYNCAPYGYYGPEWFSGGVFIGAGPWFHGPPRLPRHVDNRFDPHHGYIGPNPARGDRAFNHFTETRCVMGAVTEAAEATEGIARNNVKLKENSAA